VVSISTIQDSPRVDAENLSLASYAIVSDAKNDIAFVTNRIFSRTYLKIA